VAISSLSSGFYCQLPVENEMNDHSDNVVSLVAIVVIIWAVGCFCGTLISASIILSLLQHPWSRSRPFGVLKPCISFATVKAQARRLKIH